MFGLKVTIFISLIMLGTALIAQQEARMANPCDNCKKELKARNKQLLRQFKKLPCSDSVSNPLVIPYVIRIYDGLFEKKEFEDSSFINNLAVHFDDRKRFLRSKRHLNTGLSVVHDTSGNILARGTITSCENYTDSLYRSVPYHSLVNIILEKKINCIFYIIGTYSMCYFGTSKDRLWVIVNKRYYYEAYGLHEFIELYWDEFSAAKMKYEEIY